MNSKKALKNKRYLLLTFDIEELDLPERYNIKITEQERYEIAFKGTERIFELLKRTNTKATFFVTANFAEKFPELIREISKKYEIALHGYSHEHDYAEMDSRAIINLLSKAKSKIDKLIKKKIIGFRAPRMKMPKCKLLKRIGIKYDSSLHPTYVPGRYNNLFKSRNPGFIKGIFEMPVSVTPVLRLPFSFIWFRNMGLEYAKLCTALNHLCSNYTCVYFHPYDFFDLNEKKNFCHIPKLIKRNTGRVLEKMLERYILWCRKHKVEDITMGEYCSMYGLE